MMPGPRVGALTVFAVQSPVTVLGSLMCSVVVPGAASFRAQQLTGCQAWVAGVVYLCTAGHWVTVHSEVEPGLVRQ